MRSVALILTLVLGAPTPCVELIPTGVGGVRRVLVGSSTVGDSRKLRGGVCSEGLTPCARSILEDTHRLETNYKLAINNLVTELRVTTASLGACREGLDDTKEPVVLIKEKETPFFLPTWQRMVWLGVGIVGSVLVFVALSD